MAKLIVMSDSGKFFFVKGFDGEDIYYMFKGDYEGTVLHAMNKATDTDEKEAKETDEEENE